MPARIATLALVILGLGLPVAAQPPDSITVSDTLSSNGDSFVVQVRGFASARFQPKDSYSGTWEVQCSVDGGTTYDTDDEVNLSLEGASSAAVQEVTDTVGIWTASVAGCTHLKVIATAGFAASDTTIAVGAVVSGGSSGGGGGGGSGGAVTQGTSPWIVSGAGTAGVSGVNALTIQGIASGTAVPVSGTVTVDAGTGWSVDPCSVEANHLRYVVDLAAAGVAEVANASASNYFRVCHIDLQAAGGANNIAFVEDDTDTCASPTAGLVGGTTTGEGWIFATGAGITLGNAQSTILKSSVVNRYACLITSAATQVTGVIVYVLQP